MTDLRELDAKCAELMGWRTKKVAIRCADGPFGTMDFDAYFDGEDEVRLAGDWSPTTNIADAMDLAEKVRPVPMWYALVRNHEVNKDRWTFSFCYEATDEPAALASADTAPLAIVRAVLALQGVEL